MDPFLYLMAMVGPAIGFLLGIAFVFWVEGGAINKGGYQPTTSVDTTNPPQGGSGGVPLPSDTDQSVYQQ